MFLIKGIPGSGSEIIDALIDFNNYEFVSYGLFLTKYEDRDILLKPENTTNVAYKELIPELAKKYNSMTVWPDNNLFRQIHGYKSILIDWSSNNAQDWVVNRLEQNNLPLPTSIITSLIQMKYDNKTQYDLKISLEEILSGRMLEKLQPFVEQELNSKLYDIWLEMVLDNHPFPL